MTLTENQFRIIKIALEEYFRLRLGQDMDFCNDVAMMNADLSIENPDHEKIFDRYIHKRDCMREVMSAFFHIAFGCYGVPEKKTCDMLIAEDIWDQMRVVTGTSKWQFALHVSDEPLPKIEEI